MTLAEYLFRKANAAGAKMFLGIPGDFALPLFRTLDKMGDAKVVTFTHEPALGYAADAYARLNGFAVAIVTYGAGGLNMVNPIAQAYAEKSPVLVVCGAPEILSRKENRLVHHRVKTFESQRRIYEEVCCATAILERATDAVAEINYVIEKILTHQRPGYIELPRDMTDLEVGEQAITPLVVNKPRAQSKNFSAVITNIAKQINAAKNPVIYAGVEIKRYRLGDVFKTFVEQTNLPFTTSMEGKSVISETHPNFIGTYMGNFGPQTARSAMDDADLIINVGTLLSDVNLGMFTGATNITKMLHITSDGVSISGTSDAGVTLPDVLPELVMANAVTKREFPKVLSWNPPAVSLTGPITTDKIVSFINDYSSKMPSTVVLDVGDILFSSCNIRAESLMSPGYYASMGFSVPGAIAACLSFPEKRAIALVGDGAFQMTGMELGTAKRFGLKPLVIVMNNNGFETMRAFDAKREYYNVPHWDFVKLAQAMDVDAVRVDSTEALVEAVKKSEGINGPFLIEAVMATDSLSSSLKAMTKK